MRKLSTWAKKNPWKSRLIIITGHLLLIALALKIARLLNQEKIFLSSSWLFLSGLLFIAAIVLYPSAAQKRRLSRFVSYRWQKSADFLIGLTGFCMLLVTANRLERDVAVPALPVFASSHSAIGPGKEKKTAEEILASLEHRDKSSLTRPEKRILKKEFKKQLGVYAKAKITGDEEGSSRAGLIILAIIAALGLLTLLGALACSVACNGAEGGGIILLFCGSIAVIVGLVFVIKAIKRGGKKKNQPDNIALKK